MQILDGKGRGNSAGVSDDNLLETLSASYSLIHYAAHHSKRAFFTYLTDNNYLTLTTTGGYVFVISNTGQIDINLSRAVFTVGSAALIWMQRSMVIGTLGNYAAAPYANVNLGSSNVPDAGIYAWDGVGDGITGLSGGSKMAPMFIPAGGVVDLNLNDSIIIPPGGVFCVGGKGVGGTAIFQLMTSFFHHNHD